TKRKGQKHNSAKSFLGNCYDFDLSKYDDVVIFVDENEEIFPTKYLTSKNLLNGGWKGIRNEDILNKVGVFLMVDRMRKLRLGWFRFVKRRSNTNNTITKESMLLLFTY
ncbi:hypothetical protein H5410_002572, partial [Solanum commersonii]